MNLYAGVLRRIARIAHDRTHTAGDREIQIDMDGVVAVLFAAASLEAFVNELGALAESRSASNPPSIAAFASLLTTVEESHGATRLKFAIVGQAFAGRPFDRSIEPFQGCDLLFTIRDAAAHLKAERFQFGTDGQLTSSSHTRLLERLRSRTILAEYNPADYVGAAPAWISLLSPRAAARWSCNVASAVVIAVLDSIPESEFKREAAFMYRDNFRPVHL